MKLRRNEEEEKKKANWNKNDCTKAYVIAAANKLLLFY